MKGGIYQLKIYRFVFMDVKNILTGLFDRLSGLRAERPTAGTKFRLMGMVADIAEVAQTLQQEVLLRVSQEAALDVDVDVDFADLAEQVMSMELMPANAGLQEQTEQVNDALGALSAVLAQIDDQLSRRHKDEEYARVYEQEKRRYMNSGTPGRVRRTFDDWLYDVCTGVPNLEHINDYVTEKLVHMFEKGVFNAKVEHIQRATRYPAEFDFSQLDDDHKLRKTVHKHYSEFRKLVDYYDGYLVVDPVKVGRHFFASRHEENAKAHRSAFMKYMHKIELAQQERRKVLDAQADDGEEQNPQLNYFAPAKHLKMLLQEEWFEIHRTDKRYDQQWTDGFISALMKSDHKVYVATEWGRNRRQDYVRGCVLGLLKEGGVIKGSMDSIARSAGVCENYRTFSKYMGQCRQEPYADWVLEYIRLHQ